MVQTHKDALTLSLFLENTSNWLDEIVESFVTTLKFTEHHGIWFNQTIVTFRDKTFASARMKITISNEFHE